MCLLHPISAGTIPSSTEQGEPEAACDYLLWLKLLYYNLYVLSVVFFCIIIAMYIMFFVPSHKCGWVRHTSDCTRI